MGLAWTGSGSIGATATGSLFVASSGTWGIDFLELLNSLSLWGDSFDLLDRRGRPVFFVCFPAKMLEWLRTTINMFAVTATSDRNLGLLKQRAATVMAFAGAVS